MFLLQYAPEVQEGRRHPMVPLTREALQKYARQEGREELVRSKNPLRRRRRKDGAIIVPQRHTRHPVATAKTISPYLTLPQFKRKERLLTILHEAHYFNDTADAFFQDTEKVETLARHLPTWEQVTERLGGEEPFIVGLDRCQDYQALVPPVERLIGVSGMFATGTNLLASLLINNCRNEERSKAGYGDGIRWQVNWGKHSPARFRLKNHLEPKLKNENYLPVVTTRHPYSWMQSMCRQRYSTHWFHNAQEHCPNLVPNEIDRRWYNITTKYGKPYIHNVYQDPWLRDNLLDLANFTLDMNVVPVRVRYASGVLFHDSLIHMWNDWYHEYIDAEFPRIIVRLEDLVFHAKEVVTRICTCTGGTVADDFQYVTQTAKVGGDNIHGKAEDRTNLFKWLTHFHLEDRLKNMTNDDHEYAVRHLDPELLKMFGYYPPPPLDS